MSKKRKNAIRSSKKEASIAGKTLKKKSVSKRDKGLSASVLSNRRKKS